MPKKAAVPHPPMEAYHPVWSESVWMYYDTVSRLLFCCCCCAAAAAVASCDYQRRAKEKG